VTPIKPYLLTPKGDYLHVTIKNRMKAGFIMATLLLKGKPVDDIGVIADNVIIHPTNYVEKLDSAKEVTLMIKNMSAGQFDAMYEEGKIFAGSMGNYINAVASLRFFGISDAHCEIRPVLQIRGNAAAIHDLGKKMQNAFDGVYISEVSRAGHWIDIVPKTGIDIMAPLRKLFDAPNLRINTAGANKIQGFPGLL
jgi:hypothetical protein